MNNHFRSLEEGRKEGIRGRTATQGRVCRNIRKACLELLRGLEHFPDQLQKQQTEAVCPHAKPVAFLHLLGTPGCFICSWFALYGFYWWVNISKQMTNR